jgi:glycosyltransferase involved in cell wall biosynthesis
MVTVTVFTPTYNRAETLHRVRDSLCRQTLDPDRFEWVVVDDGSTDGTRELVETWMGGPFAIRYAWQPNAGKHVAWNRGVADARGELFTCLDSDDACSSQALERFASLWEATSNEKRSHLAGILVRCQTPDGVPVGPAFPKVDTADFVELVLLHGIHQETWMALRTELLRKNLFPEVRVPYLPEGVLLHKIARHYRWLLHDECLRTYFGGRPDQITKLPGWRYAEGMALMHQAMLDHNWRFLWNVPMQFFRSSIHFGRFSLHAGLSISRQIRALEQPNARALCWSVLPAVYALYAVDKYRARDQVEVRRS